MRTLKILTIISVAFLMAIGSASYRPLAASQTISKSVSALQANTLCAKKRTRYLQLPNQKTGEDRFRLRVERLNEREGLLAVPFWSARKDRA